MDGLTALLDGPRARGAFLLRALLDPPWCLRVQDESPLALVAMVRGHAWVSGRERFRLGPGDILVTSGPEPYTIGDDPATPVQVVIHPGNRCATPDGRDLHQEMDLGVRSWGTDPDGAVAMLVGTYDLRDELSGRLLRSLPPMLVVGFDSPLTGLLADEIVKERPGQEAVLDRLLDLLLIAVLREWFARPSSPAPGWYSALGDPVVGRALRLIHHNPSHAWTVSALASAAGVSRATFARRFHELVGEPPMAFLTGFRLDLAADLLREPGVTVGSVARRVGYGSSFALSTAFKRARGVSPQQHRRDRAMTRP